MPPISAVILCAILGLIFGSFLNVCIVRLPRHESIVAPGSHCRSCGAAISWRDNIPVLGWILLRGRCRGCGKRISARYPLVELATSILFLLCLFRFWPGWEVATWAFLCFLLLGLALMDAETMLLPDRFTLPGLAAGVVVSGLHGGLEDGLRFGLRSAGIALADAAITAAVLLLIAGIYWIARRRAGLGLGDVKFLAMLAAWLGLAQAALSLVLALIAGAIFSALLVARSRNKQENARIGTLAIPFGTFLSAAGIYAVFLGERTLRWYLQLFH